MKKVLSMALVCLLVVTMLTACAAEASIVGSWGMTQDEYTYTYTFNEDGTGVIAASGISLNFTWESADGKVTLKTELADEAVTMDYSISGDKLTLISEEGEESVLTKQ